MTTAEYFQTPETVLPSELAYGAMRVAEAPTVSHQRIVGDLFISLTAHVRERALGEVLLAPTDVILDYEAGLVVQPDLLYVSTERAHIIKDRVCGAPDLTVEVLSPHPRVGTLDERIEWFCRYGVKECWLVKLPERHVAVLTLSSHGIVRRLLCGFGSTIRSTLLPEYRGGLA